MSRIFIILVLFISFIRCTTNDDQEENTFFFNSYPFTYELKKISFGSTVSALEKGSLDRTETISFDSPDTFTFSTTTVKDNSPRSFNGTYVIDRQQKEPRIAFTYTTPKTNIRNCSNSHTEVALFKSDRTLLISTLLCDGPEYLYGPE